MQIAAAQTPPTTGPSLSMAEKEEAPGRRLERAVGENPVVVFSRASCCMCHAVRRLLAAVGVQPTVIELGDGEIESLSRSLPESPSPPVLFIGGELVGGLESLVGLHLSGALVPRLKEAGALWV